MTISLTPEQEKFVTKKVRGGYRGADAVIEEGLRLLDQQDQLVELGLDRLRAEIAVGLKQLKAGHGISGEKVFDEIRRRSQARRSRRR